MPIDNDELERSLHSLRSSLPDQETDLGGALARVADATRLLFSADGAGVMLIDEDRALAVVTSDDPRSKLLETSQRDLGRGPCVDCLVLDHLIMTDDVLRDPRWPGLAELLAPSEIRSILGVPVRIGGGALGSLNVYRLREGDWAHDEVAAIEAYAGVVEDLVGSALLAHQRGALADQLQHALDSRVVIERAVGFLMASGRVDAVTAFDQLRRRARSERRKVSDIATELVGTPAAE